MTVRVALVDDHPLVLEGLRRALEAAEGIEVAGTASTLAEGAALLARGGVDVAVIDLRLPGGLGTNLIAAATARGRPATIVLSSFDHATYVAAAVRLGAAGFLLKTTPTEQILAAIRVVATGGTAYTAAQLGQARQPAIELSERERAIVERLIASRSNDEIAADLGLASKTIEKHLGRMFDRFGAMSRTELAMRAEREGWLDL
jgi:DNA-binding NarL/FixJ family response regulator